MEDSELENGAEGEWSPIRSQSPERTDQENVASVLVATEGEHTALLGLARGMIVPVVRDDPTTAVGNLANSSGRVKPVQKESSPHVSEPRPMPKASPVNKPISSSTRSSAAANNDLKHPSRPPPSNFPKSKKSPSKPSPVRGPGAKLLPNKGVLLQGKRPPQKAVLVLGGANEESVPGRGVPLHGSRPPQKGASVLGGASLGVFHQGVSSAVLADAFLAGVQLADSTKGQNGNDLVFTFSDDSDDDASATDSLQSEMDQLRAQMQKLEAGRKTPELEVGRKTPELNEAGAGEKLEAGRIGKFLEAGQKGEKLEVGRTAEEGNGSRPGSGGTRRGVLSRFAGRLGPLKGGVITSTNVAGGQNSAGKEPPVTIVPKAMPAGSALEAMRKRVALMEQEVKQGGVKVGRLVPPLANQIQKVNGDKGATLAASRGGVNELAAQPAKKDGSGGLVSRLEGLGTGAGGILLEANKGLGVEKAAVGPVLADIGKRQKGSPVGIAKAGALKVSNGAQGNAKALGKQSLTDERANALVPANKSMVSANEPMTSGTGLEGRPQSAPPAGRESNPEGSLARTGSGKVKTGPGDSHRLPNGGGRSSPKKNVVPGEAHREGGTGQILNKRKAGPGELERVSRSEGAESPNKRKAAPVEIDRALKQPKVEKVAPAPRMEAAGRPTNNPGHHTPLPAGLTQADPSGVLLTSADSPEAETGALVVFASAAVTSAERQLAMTSAERQLAVTSAERQLAALTAEDDRCCAELQQGEKDVLEWGRKREELRQALLEVDRKELEARAQVAAMQERLAGNRRLRSELELRDNLEKQLRQMMNGGGGLVTDVEGSISAGLAGINDGVKSVCDAAWGISVGAEGISDGIRGMPHGEGGLQADAGGSNIEIGTVGMQNMGRLGEKGTDGEDGFGTAVPKLTEAISDRGLRGIGARELLPGAAAHGLPSRAARVGVKGPSGGKQEVENVQVHKATGSQPLTAVTTREANESGLGGGANRKQLGLKSPGKKARPKALPGVQSPGGKVRPKPTGEVAKATGRKVPGASKPIASKELGSLGPDRPSLGVSGQVQQKVVGLVQPKRKAEAGKEPPSKGDGVNVHSPVSGGQKELGPTPPGRRDRLAAGLFDNSLSKSASLDLTSEERDVEHRQSVGRKRLSESEVSSISRDAKSIGVGLVESTEGSSEPSLKRARLEKAEDAEKQRGETRQETDLAGKHVGGEGAVSQDSFETMPVAGERSSTAGNKAGNEACPGGAAVVQGTVVLTAGTESEERTLGKHLAERNVSAEGKQAGRKRVTGQLARKVNGEQTRDALAVGTKSVMVGEKRVRDAVEETTERKKATGERVVGGENPGTSVPQEDTARAAGRWDPGISVAQKDTVTEKWAVGKDVVDSKVENQTGERTTEPQSTGEKAVEGIILEKEVVGDKPTGEEWRGGETTREKLVNVEAIRATDGQDPIDASREAVEEKIGRMLSLGAGVGGVRANAGLGGPVMREPEAAVVGRELVKVERAKEQNVREVSLRMASQPMIAPSTIQSGLQQGFNEPGATVANRSPEKVVLSAPPDNGLLPEAMVSDLVSPSQKRPKAHFEGSVLQPNPPPGTVFPSSSIQPEYSGLDREAPLVQTKPFEPSQPSKSLKPPKPSNPFRGRLAELQAHTVPPRGPYKGALTAFKSFRLTPQYGEVWARGFGSLTWSNDVIPDWPLCTTELLTGQCAVGECGYQHARDYVLGEDALLAQLTRYGTAKILPRGEGTTLEQRAAQVVEQLERRKIGAAASGQPAHKNWKEAPVPIYRVGNYLMDHRERSLPTGRGFSVPRAVAFPVLSPGIVRPITPSMPFIGDREADNAGGNFTGWRYWERISEGDKDRESESWEVALQRALDVVDNNLANRNTEKLDEALAILARALEEDRHVPCLWAVYLELFIRRAKDDGEATQMIEAAVCFNPGPAALWSFYYNTRGTSSDKLRVCQRARSSILTFLAAQKTRDTFKLSAVLLDFTLRGLNLLSETGDGSAASDEVRALVSQAGGKRSPESAVVATNGSSSGVVEDGSVPGAVVVTNTGEVAKQSVGGGKATTQSAKSERVALLANLSPEDSVTLWVSCAYLLGYGRLPKHVLSRLGYEQPVPAPEDIWQVEGDQLPLLPGSEVAVLQVFEVALKALTERAAFGDAGLHSLASHSVAVTALLLGTKEAVTVCERLLGTYPGHTDLAFRRAAMLLGEAPENRPQDGESHRNQTEVAEALRCLRTIASQPNPTETERREAESNGERCLALLRSAQLLLTWSSKEAALECLAQLFDDPSNDCLEAVCCRAMKAALEGDRSRANLLVESVNPSLVRTSADVRLVAELRTNFAVGQSPEAAISGLAGVLRPGLDNPSWPALTLSPVAPPWADVTSEGLRKQVSRAWVSKPAWDYDLVNKLVSAWLPQLKTANAMETANLVDILEAFLTLVPGNVPLSLLGGELCQTCGCDSWSLPLVLEALTLARPEPLAGFWESLAERCSKAGHGAAAAEVRLLAKRSKGS